MIRLLPYVIITVLWKQKLRLSRALQVYKHSALDNIDANPHFYLMVNLNCNFVCITCHKGSSESVLNFHLSGILPVQIWSRPHLSDNNPSQSQKIPFVTPTNATKSFPQRNCGKFKRTIFFQNSILKLIKISWKSQKSLVIFLIFLSIRFGGIQDVCRLPSILLKLLLKQTECVEHEQVWHSQISSFLKSGQTFANRFRSFHLVKIRNLKKLIGDFRVWYEKVYVGFLIYGLRKEKDFGSSIYRNPWNSWQATVVPHSEPFA